MKYCTYCGKQLRDYDKYCLNCGKKTIGDEEVFHDSFEKRNYEPLDKLVNELAYMGTLFWLPLVLGEKNEFSRYCANQGLWVLICSVISCTVLRLFGYLNGLFTGEIAGIFSGTLYSIVFMFFLIFMGYLFVQVVLKAQEVHRDEEPKSILWFERIPIIH